MSDVFEVRQEDISLGFHGDAQTVFVQAKFQEMGLDSVFDLFYSRLVGCVAENN
jgi:hypothetical protein